MKHTAYIVIITILFVFIGGLVLYINDQHKRIIFLTGNANEWKGKYDSLEKSTHIIIRGSSILMNGDSAPAPLKIYEDSFTLISSAIHYHAKRKHSKKYIPISDGTMTLGNGIPIDSSVMLWQFNYWTDDWRLQRIGIRGDSSLLIEGDTLKLIKEMMKYMIKSKDTIHLRGVINIDKWTDSNGDNIYISVSDTSSYLKDLWIREGNKYDLSLRHYYEICPCKFREPYMSDKMFIHQRINKTQ